MPFVNAHDVRSSEAPVASTIAAEVRDRGRLSFEAGAVCTIIRWLVANSSSRCCSGARLMHDQALVDCLLGRPSQPPDFQMHEQNFLQPGKQNLASCPSLSSLSCNQSVCAFTPNKSAWKHHNKKKISSRKILSGRPFGARSARRLCEELVQKGTDCKNWNSIRTGLENKNESDRCLSACALGGAAPLCRKLSTLLTPQQVYSPGSRWRNLSAGMACRNTMTRSLTILNLNAECC